MTKKVSSLKARVASSFGIGAMALALVIGGAQGNNSAPVADTTAASASVAAPEMDLAGTSYRYWYNENTSPAFAARVADRFSSSMFDMTPDSGYVYSPTTGKSYYMTCGMGSRYYICTGGNGAKVWMQG